MPIDQKREILNNPIETHLNEVPITAVHYMGEKLKVNLIEWPKLSEALVEMTNCGYDTKANTVKDFSLKALFENNSLWQALECIHFKFLVTGCTRIFTHQLVRQRIGISFSQQCSGEVDWRHANIIFSKYNKEFVENALTAKHLYAKDIDAGNSLQDSRYILPHCLETFIYFDCSLATAMNIYQKRTCVMSNAWEMHLFAEKLKIAILFAFPEVKALFENPCKNGKCWYNRVKEQGNNVFLYQPDDTHDHFYWNTKSFVYGGTHRGMSAKPFPTQWFMSTIQIEESEYNERYANVYNS